MVTASSSAYPAVQELQSVRFRFQSCSRNYRLTKYTVRPLVCNRAECYTFLIKYKGGIIIKDINTVLQLTHVTKTYPTQSGEKTALSDISLKIPQNELFCIMGTSGSGKSTLLKLLGGFEEPDSGEILISGRKMSAFTAADYDAYRQKQVGFIFQDFNLLDGLTLKENILLPLAISNADSSDIEEKYRQVMHYLDLTAFEHQYPEKSSGGQQQRAAICRALIKSPDIILADEPTGSLDSRNARAVLDALAGINRQLPVTVVIVTHDAAAASYCDTVIFME